MKKKHDLAVIIGRWNIFHDAHMKLVEEATKVADNVLILVGSVNRSRSLSNPFTYEERAAMINNSLEGSNLWKCEVKPLEDYLYVEYEWESRVQFLVHDHLKHLDSTNRSGGKRVVLVGHEKDNTSYYLNGFPSWDKHLIGDICGISATPLREMYFSGSLSYEHMVPEGCRKFLMEFSKTDEYQWVVDHKKSIDAYKEPYKDLPYGINFITGDALVVCRGHLLLIRRRDFPGKGQWALPGGFKNPGEYSRDCILRELLEETKIDVPSRVLAQSYKGKQLFEDPRRDDRGDFTTHVGQFILTDSKLPKVKGADDAVEARWFPFSQVRCMSKELFADHYFIITKMLASGYGTGFTL